MIAKSRWTVHTKVYLSIIYTSWYFISEKDNNMHKIFSSYNIKNETRHLHGMGSSYGPKESFDRYMYMGYACAAFYSLVKYEIFKKKISENPLKSSDFKTLYICFFCISVHYKNLKKERNIRQET